MVVWTVGNVKLLMLLLSCPEWEAEPQCYFIESLDITHTFLNSTRIHWNSLLS